MNQGWICPRCDAVMSPTTPTCFYCKPKENQHERLEQLATCTHDVIDRFCWHCNLKLLCQSHIDKKSIHK